jgi:hypothetical protein
MTLKLHVCGIDGCGKRFTEPTEKRKHESTHQHCPTCGQPSEVEITQDNIHKECEWCEMERDLNAQYGVGPVC